jgi:hypothetical protein
MFDDMPNPYQDLYVWDSLEKRGFPLSEHIKCIHLDREAGRREFIATATREEIDTMIAIEGDELTDVILEVLKTFTGLLFKVYQDQSDEKRQEIIEFIRGMAGE